MAARRKWFPKGRQARSALLGLGGGLLLLVFGLMAVLAPYVSPHDPLHQDPDLQLEPPSETHILGTDYLGRDILSRIIWGARTSLGISFAAVFIGTAAGAVLGLWSGLAGGRVDMIIQRAVDIAMAVPGMVLAMALVAVLGASFLNVLLSIAAIIAPSVTRVVRGSVLQVRELQYVEAARALGMSDGRIALVHVLPNVVAPLLVMATASLGNAILIEASLSFLGIGTPPPDPTWGGMLGGEARTWLERAPWMAFYPGLALTLTVIAFNLFGDYLRDVLDPKLRR